LFNKAFISKISEKLTGILLGTPDEKLYNRTVKPNFTHMGLGASLVAAIIVFNFQFFASFGASALGGIAVFNLLFVFLFFPLNGSFLRKTALLIIGNLVGLLWHTTQLTLTDSALFFHESEMIKIVVAFAKPVLDFGWMVAVWSISLTLLASKQRKVESRDEN